MYRCTSYIWLLGISCINITVATHPTGHTVLWYVRLAHCLYMAHNTPNYFATSYITGIRHGLGQPRYMRM